MNKTRKILITGAGSGLGEGTAIGLVQNGHEVIAAAQTWPQVTALRAKAAKLRLSSLRIEKLDLLDSYEAKQACTWDFDVLVNNAGVGEGGGHATRAQAFRDPGPNHQSRSILDRVQRSDGRDDHQDDRTCARDRR
jgi:NADP-dependent 3-hydroxy acid dehydrogenase YdfG